MENCVKRILIASALLLPIVTTAELCKLNQLDGSIVLGNDIVCNNPRAEKIIIPDPTSSDLLFEFLINDKTKDDLNIAVSDLKVKSLLEFSNALDKLVSNNNRIRSTTILESKDSLEYLPSESKPFTGVHEINQTSIWYKNGKKIAEIVSDNLNKSGLITLWNKPKYKATQVTFKDDFRVLTLSAFYESGQQMYEANFENFKANGLATAWYRNGNKAFEEMIKIGIPICIYTKWYESGQKEYESNCGYGLVTSWYENGQKRSEVNFHNDKRNGKATFWYKNGQIDSEVIYKDDIEVKEISSWYEDGRNRLDKN